MCVGLAFPGHKIGFLSSWKEIPLSCQPLFLVKEYWPLTSSSLREVAPLWPSTLAGVLSEVCTGPTLPKLQL